MRLLTVETAADYLREQGCIDAGEAVSVLELPGGVSNCVLYVARPDFPGSDFVLKQSRPQLRTPSAWYCTVERIWREVEVLRICSELLGDNRQPAPDSSWTVTTPVVLFEDRAAYCFTMTAAPPAHRVWKSDLMAGIVDPTISAACGQLLARLHAGSWLVPEVAAQLGDRALFDSLRVDPYYRTCAVVLKDVSREFEKLIDSVWEHAYCLTHADFSPKNLLVYADQLMMVDFETGHFGDPAFDIGFFLSHLVLKRAHHAQRAADYLNLCAQFWSSYRQMMERRIDAQELQRLEARGMAHLAACVLARLCGKSRIDYLDHLQRREQMRGWAQGFLQRPCATWEETCVSLPIF